MRLTRHRTQHLQWGNRRVHSSRFDGTMLERGKKIPYLAYMGIVGMG